MRISPRSLPRQRLWTGSSEKGQWKVIFRFLIKGERPRLIDDGRRGAQNRWSSLSETIYTIGVDFVPEAVALMMQLLLQAEGRSPDEPLDVLLASLPDWASVFMATADLPDAFRGCPIREDHQRAAVVAVWDLRCGAWRFGVMNGCPYGLGSVVVTFNRYPALVTATCRR